MNKKEPIISINWQQLVKDIVGILKFLRQAIIFILKIIIKIATFVVLVLLTLYKEIRKFCKSEVKGLWIFILIVIFTIIMKSVTLYANKEIKKSKEEVIKERQKQEQFLKRFFELEEKINDLQVYVDTKSIAKNSISPTLTRVKGNLDNVIHWKPLIEKRFPPEQVNNALLVMACESRGNPKAINKDDAKITGHCSYGLFQINGPDNWEWDNPEENADRALDLFLARGWQPWFNCSKKLGLI